MAVHVSKIAIFESRQSFGNGLVCHPHRKSVKCPQHFVVVVGVVSVGVVFATIQVKIIKRELPLCLRMVRSSPKYS